MRETVAPLASLTPAAAAPEPQKATPVRHGVLLGRSDTLGRSGLAPVLLHSSFSRGDEPSGANAVRTSSAAARAVLRARELTRAHSPWPQETLLPAELQIRQMLHELPPHERHALQSMPPHVQVRTAQLPAHLRRLRPC